PVCAYPSTWSLVSVHLVVRSVHLVVRIRAYPAPSVYRLRHDPIPAPFFTYLSPFSPFLTPPPPFYIPTSFVTTNFY
ncbi:hypothetical protein P152DRAFT_463131, partial [Eremomyces bilateralis CBS 781.70]